MFWISDKLGHCVVQMRTSSHLKPSVHRQRSAEELMPVMKQRLYAELIIMAEASRNCNFPFKIFYHSLLPLFSLSWRTRADSLVKCTFGYWTGSQIRFISCEKNAIASKIFTEIAWIKPTLCNLHVTKLHPCSTSVYLNTVYFILYSKCSTCKLTNTSKWNSILYHLSIHQWLFINHILSTYQLCINHVFITYHLNTIYISIIFLSSSIYLHTGWWDLVQGKDPALIKIK